MKNFDIPEIKCFPLVIKDQITLSIHENQDGYDDGSGIILPEDGL